MQYKIPVQIENEDPIILNLSLRQLSILMVGFWISYVIFTSLEPQIGWEIALVPSGIIAIITILIAVFKQYEMTFVPFMLAFIRKFIFPSERWWEWGVDSFQAIDVWYVTNEEQKTDQTIDLREKQESMNELQEKLKKI